jgi:pyruvate, orthophosphate dikinase
MAAALVLQIGPDTPPDRDLIGGKAASLALLSREGVNVPPAFVVTTEGHRRWANGSNDAVLTEALAEGISGLARRSRRPFTGGGNGLLVSVRSGAPVSMPGMMDTLLNVGIARLSADAPQFLCEARARFLWQYADLVAGFDHQWLQNLRAQYPAADVDTVNAIETALCAEAERSGRMWPQSNSEELLTSARAVFSSWHSPRAQLYRRMRGINDSIGTTVTVQQMIFGNRDLRSGSGVAFTRNPTSGERGLHGEFKFGAQGEEIVAGRETGEGLSRWKTDQPECWNELCDLGRRLEAAQRRVYELEFTVEQGKLYVLQCRPALLTARAGARVAVEMVAEGSMTRDESLSYAQSQGFDPKADPSALVVRAGATLLGRGIPVGGGVATGRVAFDKAGADELMKSNQPVVFIATETSPGLLPLMQRSAALVTMRGGATSHAAVVARELDKPCVVGVGAAIENSVIRIGPGVASGEWITVDGDSGEIYAGDAALREARLSEFEKLLREWAQAVG